MAQDIEKQTGPLYGEMGVTGLKVWGGYVDEEFLIELSKPRAYRVYDEMSKNDATVGSILYAIDLLVRATEWKVDAVNDSPEAVAEKEFVESVMDDMSHTWEDFVSEAMTMLVYGWSFFEHVFKRRIGPYERNPKFRSRHSDGLIGIRKLAPRAQDTLDKWDMQHDGGINGWTQIPWTGYTEPIYIPMHRGLLFRTTTRKNNPEGQSILRTAYTSWYRLKQIQSYEAVGIERELAGLPVAKVPMALLNDTSAEGMAALNMYKQMVRDVRINDQGGVILPSDVYEDNEGKPTNVPMYSLELISSGGRRAIETNSIIGRYQKDIARSVLADFLMLGADRVGSFALSENKTTLFLTAIKTYNKVIASTLNMHLLPRLWKLNGKNPDLMPEIRAGSVTPTDLDSLSVFIERMYNAGFPVNNDEELEAHLRTEAGLPARTAPYEIATTNIPGQQSNDTNSPDGIGEGEGDDNDE